MKGRQLTTRTRGALTTGMSLVSDVLVPIRRPHRAWQFDQSLSRCPKGNVPRSAKAVQAGTGFEFTLKPTDKEHRMAEIRVDRRLFASRGPNVRGVLLGLTTKFAGRHCAARDRSIRRDRTSRLIVTLTPGEEPAGVVDVGSPGLVSHCVASTGGFVPDERRAQIVVVPGARSAFGHSPS